MPNHQSKQRMTMPYRENFARIESTLKSLELSDPVSPSLWASLPYPLTPRGLFLKYMKPFSVEVCSLKPHSVCLSKYQWAFFAAFAAFSPLS
jgi:hypothetical protein